MTRRYREATMTDAFAYTELLPLGPDETEYRLVTTEGVDTVETPVGTFLQVEPDGDHAR